MIYFEKATVHITLPWSYLIYISTLHLWRNFFVTKVKDLAILMYDFQFLETCAELCCSSRLHLFSFKIYILYAPSRLCYCFTLDSVVKSSNVFPYMYEIVYNWKLFYIFGYGMLLLVCVSFSDVTVMEYCLKWSVPATSTRVASWYAPTVTF